MIESNNQNFIIKRNDLKAKTCLQIKMYQNKPQGTNASVVNADQQVTTMPLTQIVTPIARAIVSN